MNHSKNNQPLARARREDLVVQETPDEVLVYDLKNHKAHCLNETAAFVWKHCDGRTTVSEMAALVEKEWSKPVTEDVVWLALKQLSRAQLLEERVAPNEDGMRASRRAVLRRLGAAAAMTPLVISIVAPTASAGASVPPVCLTCAIFGSGSGRTNTCPAICTPDIIGTCYNNSSCNGIGGQFPPQSCQSCFSNNPTSSSWRVA